MSHFTFERKSSGGGVLRLALMVLSAGALAGCQATEVYRPTIYPANDGVVVGSNAGVREDLVSQVALVYGPAPDGLTIEPIAGVDSIAGRASDPTLRARQEEDMRRKALRIGAMAVINIRPATIRSKGFESNPNTPFPSFRQGSTSSAFLRGTAVRYSGTPTRILRTAPVSLAKPVAGAPAAEAPGAGADGFLGGLGGLTR